MSSAILKWAILGLMFTVSTYGQTFIAWGDSLTAGAGGTPWPTQFNTLSGFTIVNRGVGGETSTQIRNRMLADTASHDDYSIIWAGRNNYTDSTTVQADIAAMVSALSGSNYFVLSITNGSYGGWEIQGGGGYDMITQLNSDLATTYGYHFIDVRSILVNSYNTFLSQDVIDYGNDTVPTSLRYDAIHLNTAGYGIVAQAVFDAYTTVAAIPEPSTYALLAGVAGFVLTFMLRKMPLHRE